LYGKTLLGGGIFFPEHKLLWSLLKELGLEDKVREFYIHYDYKINSEKYDVPNKKKKNNSKKRDNNDNDDEAQIEMLKDFLFKLRETVNEELKEEEKRNKIIKMNVKEYIIDKYGEKEWKRFITYTQYNDYFQYDIRFVFVDYQMVN
jgi:hypothetical protein